MKKISIFLAALMFFTAVAVLPGNMQEVKAYSWDELNWDWGDGSEVSCNSGRAGAQIFMDGYFAISQDLTGPR